MMAGETWLGIRERVKESFIKEHSKCALPQRQAGHRTKLFITPSLLWMATVSGPSFELVFPAAKASYVYAYVVMPEHVHLVLSEPQQDTLANALKSSKQGVSRRLIADANHFWQESYYDSNTKELLRFEHSKLSAVCGKCFVTFIAIR